MFIELRVYPDEDDVPDRYARCCAVKCIVSSIELASFKGGAGALFRKAMEELTEKLIMEGYHV
jgi:hypothetical protein